MNAFSVPNKLTVLLYHNTLSRVLLPHISEEDWDVFCRHVFEAHANSILEQLPVGQTTGYM
jgi:hypothetical protein